MRKLIPIFAALSVVVIATSMAATTTDPMKDIENKLNTLLSTVNVMNTKLNQQETTLTNYQSVLLKGINNTLHADAIQVDALGKMISNLTTQVNHQAGKLNGHRSSLRRLDRRMAGDLRRLTRDDSKLVNFTRLFNHEESKLNRFLSNTASLNNTANSLTSTAIRNNVTVVLNSHNLALLTPKVSAHGSTLSQNEAAMASASKLMRIHDGRFSSLLRSFNSQQASITQHESLLLAGEQVLGSLANDVKTVRTAAEGLAKTFAGLITSVDENGNKLKNEEQTMESIGNQLMQQQTFVEERIRSEGMSGIKSLRHSHEGTKPYYGDTHIGGSALSAHDHADYDRTIGLGEFDAVMNGVDFRTRHNDYKFKKPAGSHAYNAVEDIPFPSVPPQVSSKKTLDEKIVEMREWFKAFKDQDHSVRDYRKYFKPNLCYLEGGWTLNAKTLSEPFESDRHHIDAKSWFDLQEKIRFTSYSGSKSNLENFAYLPTMMYNYTGGIPQIAQWNYRILCHPLKQDVPTSYFQLQDDLAARLARRYTWDRMPNMRSARFKLNEFGTDRATAHTLLDSLMSEIPGKDNYGNNLTDNAFGLLHYDISAPAGTNKVLNVGYYHRWYKLMQKGAMGLQVNHRGFRDENLWVAMTTQPNIMPMSIKHCPGGHCEYQTKRVTYAVPLEIVYSTPLQGWNPLNLAMNQDSVVHKDGRNGVQTADKAYNGTSYKHYYRTPVEFYKDRSLERDVADTARSAVGVLDRNGQVRKAAPTGFRIMTPNIQDVGSVRIRYPIFPVHSEGSPVGEEVMALKEMVMKMSRNANYYETAPIGGSGSTQPAADADVDFEVRESAKNPPGLHGHDFTLTSAEYKSLMNGTEIKLTTSYNLGHQHELVIYYNTHNHNYYIRKCDGQPNCWDNHSHFLTKV